MNKSFSTRKLKGNTITAWSMGSAWTLISLPALALILAGSAGCAGSGASVSTGATRTTTANVLPPTIVTPTSTTYISNTLVLTVGGGCTTGNKVYLAETLVSGTSVPQTATCASSSYSFDLTPASDGMYSYEAYQQGVFNGELIDRYSTHLSLVWTRDTVPPSAPTIVSPATNPYFSSTNSVTLTGTCENGATVYLEGASTQDMICASSAFSFIYPNSTDGTYEFYLRQVDAAGNGTSAPLFTWIREFKPTTPFITSPAATPHRSNTSSFTVSGNCTAGYRVNLAGVGAAEVTTPANSLTQTCTASSTFSYTISKAVDGIYTLNVTQTNLGTGTTSDSAVMQWRRDTVPPTAPTITSLGSQNPFYSNGDSITISGACEANTAVVMTGSSAQQTTCNGSSTYSFSVSKVLDATYSFSIKQTDAAANSSPQTTQDWVRDTVAPSEPTRTSPGSDPFDSSDTTISIGGACETAAIVTLAGADSQTTTCAALAYNFNVTKNVDATYNFTISQADRASNSSGTTSFTWTRLSVTPETPTITTPATEPFYSTSTSLTISGACTTGATVTLGGNVVSGDVTNPANSLTQTCTLSAYSFTLTKTVDGTYNFTVKQNAGGPDSADATRGWVLDRVAPATPTIVAPSTNPYYSNSDVLTISGACEANATVKLNGGSTQNTLCLAGGTYSFSITKTVDSTYNFSITQTDGAGQSSGSVTTSWKRDVAIPSAPTILSPATSPYVGSSTLTISGGCETGTTITLGGNVVAGEVTSPAGSLTRSCSNSAYSYTVSKSSDGTYDLTLTQTDLASNVSAAASFQWIKDTSVPVAPTITSPSTNPVYTNLSALTISGTCISGYSVYLTGDSTQSMNCTGSGTFSFDVAASSDSTYLYFVSQENTATGIASPEAALQWVRDTSIPIAPTRINPPTSTYSSSGSLLIGGTCEAFATVNLTGAAAQSSICSASATYSFTVSTLADGVHSLTVAQADRAGNTSPSYTVTWTRDSTLPAVPTIDAPSTNPYEYNGNSIILSGGCTAGSTVKLTGSVVAGDISNPAGLLNQTCTAAGTYSYTINKSVDGAYDFAIRQTISAIDSGTIGQRWIRDVAPPTVTIATNPSNPNLAIPAAFSFTASESVTFECSLDNAAFSTCTSPTIYYPANGAHTFQVRATDSGGNLSNTASYSWTQAAYNSIALYHLDAVGPTIDSALYSGVNKNSLTVNTNTTSAAAVFSEGRTFNNNGIMSAPDSPTLNVITDKLTVEARVRVDTIPNSGHDVIAGQSTAAGGSYGWELRVTKGGGTGSKARFCFYVSRSASTGTELCSAAMTISTSTFYHLAVTYNAGAVKIYFNGAQIKSSSVATVVLNNSTTAFRIGQSSDGGDSAQSTIDELRISQIVRYPAPFTSSVPSAAFTAD